ncbi:MAG TPA: alanine--glyoxylate aminotransferase family protein [Ktedonobacterales bacterium]|nr:alanine--glyoxylate aminotransferase family protein [Ktedonobacterales bacterium]
MDQQQSQQYPDQNLRIPGPTPIPPEVRAALARPMINHRGPEFAAILGRVEEQLQHFFQTTNPILCFPAAGSGAMEAAIVNSFSPGDHVLSVSIGVFGNRFADIAQRFGLRVTRVEAPWGQAVDPAAVAAAIADQLDLRGVLLTHNETSTGVTNDLPALARAIRAARPDLLILADAVSSLGCVDMRMDEWDLDVVFTASQKGWMAPPGLAMIAVGPRGWEAAERATLPRFYWDFRAAKQSLDKGQTPYTPPVSIFFALEASLPMMRGEGREAIFARHHRVGELVRSRTRAMGLTLFADPAHASDTVTAIVVPAGIEAKTLIATLREREGVVISGGQGRLEGQILRIGHLGYVHEPEVAACMDALERQLAALGHRVPASASGAAGM